MALATGGTANYATYNIDSSPIIRTSTLTATGAHGYGVFSITNASSTLAVDSSTINASSFTIFAALNAIAKVGVSRLNGGPSPARLPAPGVMTRITTSSRPRVLKRFSNSQ